jgi:hypothetical protein
MRLKVLVTTFSKSMAAIAVAAMVGGPAAAQGEFDETWAGTKARVNLTGAGCKAATGKNLDMTVEMANFPIIVDPDFADFISGPNTGLWNASIFVFDADFGGQGTFVIYKNGNTVLDAPKKAAVGPSDNFFLDLVSLVGDYAVSECSKLVEFDGDLCTVTRGDASWARKGERLTVKMDMRCQYLDDKERLKNVQVKINSGPLEVVFD